MSTATVHRIMGTEKPKGTRSFKWSAFGKITLRQRLHLLDSYLANRGADRPPYLWGTAVVEICLQQRYIELWEQRNQKVHDPSNDLHLEK